jgi:Calcium binding
MARQKDEEREHRIRNEAIPDAHGDEEVAMSWYYHMEENLAFPIKAKVKLRLQGGKTEEKAVKIVEIDPKSETSLTLRLGITEGKSDRVQYISPDEIISINTTEENLEVLNDWLYWHGHPLL